MLSIVFRVTHLPRKRRILDKCDGNMVDSEPLAGWPSGQPTFEGNESVRFHSPHFHQRLSFLPFSSFGIIHPFLLPVVVLCSAIGPDKSPEEFQDDDGPEPA